MIDRKKGPKVTTQFDLKLKGVAQSRLNNGLELVEINTGTQEIIKIDFIMRTGRVQELSKATAKAAIHLIREGSTRHTGEELDNIFDFYGAVVKATSNLESSSVSLVVLLKHFEKVWPIWFHMLLYPSYSVEKIEKYKQIQSQKMKHSLAKNDVLAYRKLTEEIFGEQHPYGYNTEIEDINNLNRSQILNYYNSNLGTDKAFLVLSGKYDSATLNTIKSSFESINRKCSLSNPTFETLALQKTQIKIPTENEVQVSIKMGRRLFAFDNQDYSKMKMLDMILGGYFGSRLMKNIREQKGYTYGIYSTTHCLIHDGYFYISADVGKENIELAISEIHKEMQALREKLVPDDELRMVKNYILGQSLHNLDGPFAKANLIKDLYTKNLAKTAMEDRLNEIKTVTKKDIQEMANKFLDPNSFITVLAGIA